MFLTLASGTEFFLGLCNPAVWKLIREGDFDAALCFTSYLRASFWLALYAAKLAEGPCVLGRDCPPGKIAFLGASASFRERFAVGVVG